MEDMFDRLIEVLLITNLIAKEDKDYIYGDLTCESWCHTECRIFEPKKDKERARGKWIEQEDEDFAGGGYNMCSSCHWKFSFGAYPLIYEDNFCPHCGVKMQKEGEAE